MIRPKAEREKERKEDKIKEKEKERERERERKEEKMKLFSPMVKIRKDEKRKRTKFVKAWRRKGYKRKVKWEKKKVKEKEREQWNELPFISMVFLFIPVLLLRRDMSRDSPRRRRGKTITTPRIWIDSIKPSKKWPLRKNVGHRGDKQMLVLSDLRSPDTGRGKWEKPNDWLGPQNGSGAPFPSAEVKDKKNSFWAGFVESGRTIAIFTPGGRPKNYCDTKDPKCFKPVLKTEQSLLAVKEERFSSGTPSRKR